jgi:hypothetical protein
MTVKKNKTALQYIKSTSVALTGGTVEDVFTVTGGPILIKFLGAEITTAVSNNACNIGFTSDPTAGAGTDTALAATTTDIAQAAIGDWFYCENDGSTPIKGAIGTAVAYAEVVNGGMICNAGGIDVELQNSNPTTGACTVWLAYIPLDNDTRVST